MVGRVCRKVCHFSSPGPELGTAASAALSRIAVRMAKLLMKSAIVILPWRRFNHYQFRRPKHLDRGHLDILRGLNSVSVDLITWTRRSTPTATTPRRTEAQQALTPQMRQEGSKATLLFDTPQ